MMNRPGLTRGCALGYAMVALLMGAGCDSGTSDDQSAVGNLVLTAMADGEVMGFQLDVVDAQSSLIESRFLSVASPAGGTGETVFVVRPGDYRVTATALDGLGVPLVACLSATSPASVSKGRTTEIALVTRCQGPGRGGLGVSVGVNFAPEFTAVSYAPSRTVAPCSPAAVTVDAEDRDRDHIAYQFQVVSSPLGDPSAVAFVLDVSGNRAWLTSSVVGDFQIEARACDAIGCATLQIPVHVALAAGVVAPTCSPSCDDQNPCTTDSRAPDGTCGHAGVPDGALCTGGNLRVKLLGFNDFHGQLETGRRVANRPVGGAAVLASYLKSAQAGVEAQTMIVHAGDHVGASPPASALLQDEPSVFFLNMLANDACRSSDKLNPACNLVGALGNHEFDEGRAELLRLLAGGNFATGPFLEDPYGGARFPYVCANVVDEITNQPIVPPYVVKKVHGLPVAFIGAVLRDTPTIVTPTGVAGLRFLDEADAINALVPELQAAGVHAFVVTIHQGGSQTSFTGPTPAAAGVVSGAAILSIVDRLNDDIDVVVSGHSHSFTNSYVPNASGKAILVTQAFSGGTAYADIDLLINPISRDVVGKTAQIVTTFGDAGPGLTPDPVVAAMVLAAQVRVAPLVNQIVGEATLAVLQTQNAAGESAMGDLIADAQRIAMGTQMAFMNPGGIRASLNAGEITWGELFTIQPFGNSLVRMNLTGAQIQQVLEQQWLGQPFARIMQISGFDYTWDPARPVGSRVVEVRREGVPLVAAAIYSVTCNNFMASGGDNFTTFVAGTDKVGGPIDLDALVDYVEANTPIAVTVGTRITNP